MQPQNSWKRHWRMTSTLQHAMGHFRDEDSFSRWIAEATCSAREAENLKGYLFDTWKRPRTISQEMTWLEELSEGNSGKTPQKMVQLWLSRCCHPWMKLTREFLQCEDRFADFEYEGLWYLFDIEVYFQRLFRSAQCTQWCCDSSPRNHCTIFAWCYYITHTHSGRNCTCVPFLSWSNFVLEMHLELHWPSKIYQKHPAFHRSARSGDFAWQSHGPF